MQDAHYLGELAMVDQVWWSASGKNFRKKRVNGSLCYSTLYRARLL